MLSIRFDETVAETVVSRRIKRQDAERGDIIAMSWFGHGICRERRDTRPG